MAHWQRTLAIVWLAQFWSLMGFGIVMPFAPYYIQELGVTDPDRVKLYASLYYAVSSVPFAIMSPIWGTLADRFGRKLMMLRAYAAALVVLVLMGLAVNAEMLILMRAMQGGFTGTVTAAMTLVATTTPEEHQGEAMGWLSSALFSGVTAAAFLGGFIADAFGYRVPCFAGAALMLVSASLIGFGVKEDFQQPDRSGPRPPLGERVAVLKPLIPLYILIAWLALCRMFDNAMLPLFVQDLHGRLEGAATINGILQGLSAFGAIVSGIVLGKLADRYPAARLGSIAALVGGCCMLAIGIVPSLPVLFPARFVLALAAGGLDPITQAWLARSTPTERRGVAMGLAVSARSLGWLVAPLLSGWVARVFNLPAVFVAGAVIVWLAVPVLLWVSRKMGQG